MGDLRDEIDDVRFEVTEAIRSLSKLETMLDLRHSGTWDVRLRRLQRARKKMENPNNDQ